MHPLRLLVNLVVAGGILIVLPGATRGQDGFLGKEITKWIKELSDAKPEVRRSAAFALGKAGSKAAFAVPSLLRVLKEDKDAGVREAVAYALGEIGPTTSREAVETLKTILSKDKNAPVRRSAAFALGCYGRKAEPALAELQAALSDKEASVRQNAAWALGRLGQSVNEEAVLALCQVLSDSDPANTLVRRDAAAALGEIGRPAARAAVEPLLRRVTRDKEDPAVRRNALNALVNIVGPDDKAFAAELRDVLRELRRKKADIEEIRDAALALGNIGGPEAGEAVEVLCEALQDKDDDPTTRRLASAALAGIGPDATKAIPDLIVALSDADAPVRRNAALALGRMKEKALPAVPALIKLLNPKDQPEDVRRYAVEAIAYIGPEAAEEALPSLKRVIRDDPAWRVRQRAVWALGGLRDLRQAGVVPDLEEVLSEKEHETRLVRYEAAVLLGMRLGPDVPDKTLDVLLANLTDKDIRIYHGSDASVGDKKVEDKVGTDKVTENASGDARWLPARALGNIGPKARRAEIIDALKEAAEAKDKKVTEAAKEALRRIRE
jgi:HEAT repeat protein